jgi:peptide-methionine (S)-S-oxide reductase
MSKLETATLAGGCFWCIEAVFDDVEGVEDVVSGYMGGHDASPTYEAVCRGTTGHAEVVQIRFDPAVIGFRDLLAIFFAIHDPTTLNRQGNDVGTQYRSAIFTHSQEQKAAALEVVKNLQGTVWGAPILTEVTEAATFFPAEDYHQEYFKRNPGQGYCVAVVSPKVSKFRQKFAARLKRRQPA